MWRIYCVFIGYAFGCALTAEIVSRKIAGRSSFDVGTGNPGMANIGAQLGKKSAAIVLGGDLLKTFLACLAAHLFFPQYGTLSAAYAGLGAVLGHDYPVWHRFKGGQGVACACAMLACISLPYAAASCAIGLIVSVISGYLAIGALIIPASFLIPAFFISAECGIVCLACLALMCISQLPALKKIANGEQKKAFRK